MATTSLDLQQIIYRTARQSTDDLLPLLKYLDYDRGGKDLQSLSAAQDVASYLRRMGSNDFATIFRGGDGVPYDEVVFDVGEKLKAPGVSKSASIEWNETKIFEKVFADTLEAMSLEERRTLFQSMNVNVHDLPIGSAATIIVQHLIRQFGGFATYQFSTIIGNMVARAILGTGLSFATNAALTRTIGTLLGPIGWIATGAWLAIDLAGPAFRKTVPSVLYVGMLRQLLMNKVTIGVVGDGSVGKDSLIQHVFNVQANIDPIAGSTSEAVGYKIDGTGGAAEVINYPGFNDYRPRVNAKTDEMLNHTDAFIMVADVNGGISGEDVKILERLQQTGKPVLVCLNKWDLIRNPKDGDRLLDAARQRLKVGDGDMVRTAFDPDPRLGFEPMGKKEVIGWVVKRLQAAGKSSVAQVLAKEID